jgi:hypothetical protein
MLGPAGLPPALEIRHYFEQRDSWPGHPPGDGESAAHGARVELTDFGEDHGQE